MHELDAFGQESVDAVFDDGVSLAAANFHQHPGPRDDAVDLSHDFLGHGFVAIFVEVFHGGDSSISGSSSSESCSMSLRA